MMKHLRLLQLNTSVYFSDFSVIRHASYYFLFFWRCAVICRKVLVLGDRRPQPLASAQILFLVFLVLCLFSSESGRRSLADHP